MNTECSSASEGFDADDDLQAIQHRGSCCWGWFLRSRYDVELRSLRPPPFYTGGYECLQTAAGELLRSCAWSGERRAACSGECSTQHMAGVPMALPGPVPVAPPLAPPIPVAPPLVPPIPVAPPIPVVPPVGAPMRAGAPVGAPIGAPFAEMAGTGKGDPSGPPPAGAPASGQPILPGPAGLTAPRG